jgi:hypothetical protein
MPLSAEDVATLAERPHWTVLDECATFAPVDRGWRAVVNRLQQPIGHSRYHTAIVDRTGTTRYTREAATLVEAARNAERDVAARNALRLVPRGHG